MPAHYEIYTETYSWRNAPNFKDARTNSFIANTINHLWMEIKAKINAKYPDVVSHSVSVNSEVITLSVMVVDWGT